MQFKALSCIMHNSAQSFYSISVPPTPLAIAAYIAIIIFPEETLEYENGITQSTHIDYTIHANKECFIIQTQTYNNWRNTYHLNENDLK